MGLALLVIGLFVVAGGILIVVVPKTSLAGRNLNLLEIDHGLPDGALRSGIDRFGVIGIIVVAGGLALIVVSRLVGVGHTVTTLHSSPNPSTYAQSVIFIARVAPTGGRGTIDGGGTVTFSADGVPVCVSQPLYLVNGAYQADCTTSALSIGHHTIVATYSGDNDYTGSSAELKSQDIR